MEIGNIVTGHLNEVLGLNKDISEPRLRICKKCPLYTPRLGGMCNMRLWLNPETRDVSPEAKDDYFRGCGCRVEAKATIAKERCPAGKW